MDLSLVQLRQLTEVAQLQAALVELSRAEVETDNALDQLLAQRQTLTKHLAQLEALRPRLNTLLNDVGQVAGVISNTSKLAERTSQKVRQMDLEQSRVQLTIRNVEDIIEFKSCIQGLQESMHTKAYEKAAANVHRYLMFDTKIAEMVFDDAPDGAADREIIKTIEMELKNIIRHEFDVAIQNQDEENIARFFKLFPLLKLPDEGLTKYGQYLCRLVASKCEAELQNIRTSSGGGLFEGAKGVSVFLPFIDCLTHLFEHLANVIDAQEPLVETHYSPGQMLPLLETLQKEGDRLVVSVLRSFSDEAGIPKRLQAVKSFAVASSQAHAASGFMGGAARPEPRVNDMDLKENDRVLQDMATISQRVSLYTRFMHDRLRSQLDFVNKLASDEPITPAQQRLKSIGVNGWLRGTGLVRAKQELMAQYVTLEEFFLRRSVEKAMTMDEHEPGSLTSSCLEDTFFIFKKCVTRALSAVDVDTLCAALNLIGTSQERDFVDGLRTRLTRTAPLLEAKDARVTFLSLLNNMDAACDYATKLRRDVSEALPRAFDEELSPTQQQQVESCLSMITEPIDATVSHIESSVTTLFERAWKNELTTLLKDVLRETRLVLSDDDYDTWRTASDTHWSNQLVTEFDRSCRLFKGHSTENVFNRLMQVTIGFVCREVEKHVFKCQFNAMGAMTLDGDLRVLTSYFSTVTQWSSRDKFARLSQISTLLNLEKVTEIHDYWGPKAGSFTWRLSIAEVRQVLVLRTDFSADEINRLKL